ncbi:MAG TPA: signal peptidase I [Nitrosopumilaceae archaeon]|nr:signal peptidase I [Nitrosopumilaceae archaeon]
MTAGKVSRGVVKDIIIVVVGVLIIWFGLKMVTGTDNPFYVVSSGSMVPVLEVYDVLVVDGKIPFEDVDVGDIIVFNRPSGHDRVIVHRVAAIIDEDPFTIRTKGDANPASIPGTDFPITEEEYIGKVWHVVPQVGYITRIMQPPVNYIIIAIIIGVMVFKQISKSKKEKETNFKSLDSEDDKEQTTSDEKDEFKKIPKDNEYSISQNENKSNENSNSEYKENHSNAEKKEDSSNDDKKE